LNGVIKYLGLWLDLL